MSLVLKNIILYSGLGCSVSYTYYFHCTQHCCFYRECETESKTKAAEFNQNIKSPALQHFFIDLRSFSLTRSIFGPWYIKKDGVWILMRAAELLFGAVNRHIFSLKGFEMKLIKSYTTQTIDSRGIYLQSYPAQIQSDHCPLYVCSYLQIVISFWGEVSRLLWKLFPVVPSSTWLYLLFTPVIKSNGMSY